MTSTGSKRADPADRPIALIGYRGSGKTTVARILADRLGVSFVDTDERIVQRAGCSIARLFETSGQAAFRRLETQVLRDVLREGAGVIALGGGIVESAENVGLLQRVARVVYLSASAEVLLQRIRDDPTTTTHRPRLTSEEPQVEIRTVLRRREPLYAQAADITIDTTGRSPEDVAAIILRQRPFAS